MSTTQIEQGREPRNKDTYLKPPDLWHSWQLQTMGKGYAIQ